MAERKIIVIDLRKLKDASQVSRFTAGTVIICEGDPDVSSMYITLQGNVSVYKHFGQPNQIKLATLAAGSFFGEMSLFLNQRRTADVVADETVTALKINSNNAYEFFETQPEATYSLIRTLCTRVDDFNKRLAGESLNTNDGTANTVNAEGTVIEKLFLPGHKAYDFKIKPPRPDTVYPKKYECPFCLKVIEKDTPRQSIMHVLKTDTDLRTHYDGMEPLYFEVVTCPSCYMSAVAAQFEKASTAREKDLFEILAPYRGRFDFSGKLITDLDTMFAGLYLAALCAPYCYPKSDAVTARLWHRISWLYGDCGDTELQAVAGKNALDLYIKSYQGEDHQEEQTVRIQLIIAELSCVCGDLKNAAEFFIKVKSNRKAGAVYQRLAEDRLEEVKAARR